MAYTLLGITLGMLHKDGRFPYLKFLALLISSLAVSFFIVLYYPLLPKTYIEGVGSTTISNVLWTGLALWGFLLAYFLVKKKAYGERVSKHMALGMFFYSVGSALPVFYTYPTDRKRWMDLGQRRRVLEGQTGRIVAPGLIKFSLYNP